MLFSTQYGALTDSLNFVVVQLATNNVSTDDCSPSEVTRTSADVGSPMSKAAPCPVNVPHLASNNKTDVMNQESTATSGATSMIVDLVTVTSVMSSSSVTADSDCNTSSVNNVLNQPVYASGRKFGHEEQC